MTLIVLFSVNHEPLRPIATIREPRHDRGMIERVPMRAFAVLCVSAVLTGCQTKPVDQMSYSEVYSLAGEIMKRCEAQGVSQKDRRFKACTDHESNREIAVRRENQARLQRVGDALGEAADQQAAINAARASRVTSCTSNRYGNTVTTNCY